MFNLSFSFVVLAVSLALLQGCASVMSDPSSQASPEHWQIRGKISIRSPQESVTGYLDWTHERAGQRMRYDLLITGPFGQGSMQLNGTDKEARLQLPDKDVPLIDASGENLMQTHLGWSVPIEDIHYWVTARPSPLTDAEQQNIQYDDAGFMTQLEQHGWQVRFSRYQRQGSHWLPSLIKLSGHGYRVTVSIREWTLL